MFSDLELENLPYLDSLDEDFPCPFEVLEKELFGSSKESTSPKPSQTPHPKKSFTLASYYQTNPFYEQWINPYSYSIYDYPNGIKLHNGMFFNQPIKRDEGRVLGKKLLGDHYVFADNLERFVSKNELLRARVVNECVFLGNQEIVSTTRRPQKHKTDDFVELDGKIIRWGAFLKRDIVFNGTNQTLTSEEKKRARIEDGKAFVDGRETFWNTKKAKLKHEEFDLVETEEPTPKNHHHLFEI